MRKSLILTTFIMLTAFGTLVIAKSTRALHNQGDTSRLMSEKRNKSTSNDRSSKKSNNGDKPLIRQVKSAKRKELSIVGTPLNADSLTIKAPTAGSSKNGDTKVCNLMKANPDWYDAARKTHAKWGVPVSVQLAIMHTESNFKANAKNPNSTAQGFAQALNGMWSRYQKDQKVNSLRSEFHASSDFIGWYADNMKSEVGVEPTDAYRLYLAYHEGGNAYKKQEKLGSFKIASLARRVQQDAATFKNHLESCMVVEV